MRVISGKYKGLEIKGHDILGTRPTMDRVKESLFANIQQNVKNSICLDLFAGSGALGIEALSMGAKSCYFVDNNPKAIKTVEENIKNLNIKRNTKLLNYDYKKSLKYFNETNTKFDLIFVDPPYDYHVIEKIIKYVDEYNLLNDNGLLILEFEKETLLEKYNNLTLIKSKKYSWKYVYIYKKIQNINKTN